MERYYSGVNDFLHDDSFVRWVLYGEKDAYWKQLRKSDPAYPDLMKRARALIMHVREAEESEDIRDFEETETWRRITAEIRTEKRAPVSGPGIFRHLPKMGWAAVILLAGVTAWWMTGASESRQNGLAEKMHVQAGITEGLSEVVNREIIPMTVRLEDGSTVVLQKDSRLSFRKPFGASERKVILSGEAFFDVAKDSLRPFQVYTNEIVTQVLGTSFTVRAFEKESDVEVNVKTGKVSVFRHDQKAQSLRSEPPVILAPNQKVVFSRKEERFDKRLVDNPAPVKALSAYPRQRFEDIRVPDLLKLLEDRYSVQFVYDAGKLQHCVITTTLNDDPLFDNLEMICRTIGASFSEKDARIVIAAEGCNTP